MTNFEYEYIEKRFQKKLRGEIAPGQYKGRYDCDYNEGIKACTEVLNREYQRQNACQGQPMDGQEYKLLQEAMSKLVTPLPNNREEAFNQAVLGCKSVLSEARRYRGMMPRQEF